MIDQNEVINILKNSDPDVDVVFQTTRGTDSFFNEILLLCSSVGIFSGIWNLYLHIFNRKNKYSIKVTYETIENKKIEITINSTDRNEYENFLIENPPKLPNTVLVKVKEVS